MAASPLWVSEELEYWDNNIRFIYIAATHSELVAISSHGQLHQWRWADAHPYQRNDVSCTVHRSRGVQGAQRELRRTLTTCVALAK